MSNHDLLYAPKSFRPDSRDRIAQANETNEACQRQGSSWHYYDRRVGCDLIPNTTRFCNNLGDVNNGATDMALNDAVFTSVSAALSSKRQARQRCTSCRSSRLLWASVFAYKALEQKACLSRRDCCSDASSEAWRPFQGTSPLQHRKFGPIRGHAERLGGLLSRIGRGFSR